MLKLKLRYAVVSRELHLIGETELEREHFHAYLAFEGKCDIKNSNYFDYNSRHPNIAKPRSIDNVINYVRKCGVFIEIGTYLTK